MVKRAVTVDVVHDMVRLEVKEVGHYFSGVTLALAVFFILFLGGCEVGDEAVVGAEGIGGVTDAAFWAGDDVSANEAGGRDFAFRCIDVVGFKDTEDGLPGSAVASGDSFHGGKVLVVGDY